MPGKNTQMALVYDFDGTLAPGNLQENSFIPDIGMKASVFWAEVDQLAKAQQADRILMYMYLMLDKARSAKISVHPEDFKKRGAKIKFFKGVEGLVRSNRRICQSERNPLGSLYSFFRKR